MKKDVWLGHLCQPQILIRSMLHYVCDVKAKDKIGLLKIFFRNGIGFIQIFSHPRKLCALARENKSSFHNLIYAFRKFFKRVRN